MVERPWSKIRADLCELHGRTLLVVCVYYNNFIEVESLNKITTHGVTKALKTMFARYGVPDVVVSETMGPSLTRAEFTTFAKKWRFEHITSSPRYPQSNGKAENAVKTVKRLFSKCRASGQSEYLALVDWCNTPSEGIGTSPAQRLFGCRCKTLLPMARSLLQPRYSTAEDTSALNAQKQCQKFYYDRQAKPLKPIAPGETVRLRLPGQSTWSTGECKGHVGPRSYEVKVGERSYRRNRRQLIHAGESPTQDLPSEEVPSSQGHESCNSTDKTGGQRTEIPTGAVVPSPPTLPAPRRSERLRKQPAWMTMFHPNNPNS